jgi:glycosyltransferase involved in cell wall biosynthesis
LAERGNVQSLAEKLLIALASPELGAPLRQRAVQHFSWRSAGEAIVAAYDELTQPALMLSQRREKSVQSEWIISQK